MEEIIKVENLKKAFGERVILRGISLKVNRGEVMSIIGPSGSGKSTTLRSICALERVDAGSITICGQPLCKDGVYKKDNERSVLLKTGMVFQSFNLFPHYSVLKNVMAPQMTVLKRSADESRTRAIALLERIGLKEKIASFPCELSGGQAQRVAIARALAMDPEVLLFDEPTSALDPELTGEILAVIKGLAQEKMTMLIVTHEMAFARDVSTKVIFMDGGVVVEEGVPREVIDNPAKERTRSFLSRFRGHT